MDPKLQQKAHEWFHFAENELKAALKLLNEFNAITCFHCQQSAEKYIKGLLLFLQIDFRKSHNLDYLIDLLDFEIPHNIYEATTYLSEYAVGTRYPGNYQEISNEETVKAIAYAKSIKEYIISLAEQRGYQKD